MKTSRILSLLILHLCLQTMVAHAESITYRITAYNASIGAFTLAPSGVKPAGSYAEFENEYGATTGNRYNQVPRHKDATLWLMGWDGCVIEGVTLSLCSNNKAGSGSLRITMNGEEIYTTATASFDSEEWFGRWVSKDHATYVDIEKPLPHPFSVTTDAEVGITLKGGTQEGSLYIDAITIHYTPQEGVATESPLGWIYEKLEAKGHVTDGDILMLYRSGDAAGDIDGMSAQHYLDAIGVTSTTSVDDPFITLFTAHATPEGHWTLTNQYGQQLGASAAQHLEWDEGVCTWDIALGYDGANISNTDTRYGTLRYNAPSGSYPRFWNYTSKSLPLPYLYRRSRQQQPVISTQLLLAASERMVELGTQDTLIMRHTLLPAATTDRRITWQSSDEQVARVRSGIVELCGIGQTLITATSADGGSSATCLVTVTEPKDGISAPAAGSRVPAIAYDLQGRPVSPASRSIFIRSRRVVSNVR